MKKEKNIFLFSLLVGVLTFIAVWTAAKAVIDNSVVYCVIAMLAVNILTKIRINTINDMVSIQSQMITEMMKHWKETLQKLSRLD